MQEFTEQELQEMFEDLRFFFPQERIYSRLRIFHCLDVFNNDHVRIKQTYRRFLA